jgi:hypothetical protein
LKVATHAGTFLPAWFSARVTTFRETTCQLVIAEEKKVLGSIVFDEKL